jgi:hypothetical protein
MDSFEIKNGLIGMNKCVLLKLLILSLKTKIRQYILEHIVYNIQATSERDYIMKYTKRMNFCNKNIDKFCYYKHYFLDNLESPCDYDFDDYYKITLKDIPTKFIDLYRRRLYQKPLIKDFSLEETLLGVSNETYEVKYYNFDLCTNIVKNDTQNKKLEGYALELKLMLMKNDD